MSAPEVLLIDDDASVLRALQRVLHLDGYTVITAAHGMAALELLASHDVAVIICDQHMPMKLGVQVLAESVEVRPDAVRILLTGIRDLRVAQAAINEARISQFLLKPWDDNVLRSVVREAVQRHGTKREIRALHALTAQQRDELAAWNEQLEDKVRKQTAALEQAYDETLDALVLALDARERATAGHSMRVALYALYLALEVDLPEAELELLYRGAVLHDIGKIGVPDAVLCKPEQLDEEEWTLMRQHVILGSEWLEHVSYLRPASAIPRYHHEWYDGTGYCARLAGEDIPREARIFAVVDVYDALRSERPYKGAMSEEQTHEIIARESGTHFDPRIVDAFLGVPTLAWCRLAAAVPAATRYGQAYDICRAIRGEVAAIASTASAGRP